MNGPPPRGALGPGHLLDQQAAARAQLAAQQGTEGRVLAGAHVLAHLDRGDRVVIVAGAVSIVPDLHIDQFFQSECGDPALRASRLLARQGHRGHPAPVFAGGMNRERPPAAADVQQPQAGPQGQLGANAVELVPLRAGQRVTAARVAPVRAGVGQARVEDQLVEADRQVIVVGDDGLVAALTVRPARCPGLRGGRPGRQAGHTEPQRRPRRRGPGAGRQPGRPPPSGPAGRSGAGRAGPAAVGLAAAGQARAAARRPDPRQPSVRSPSTSSSPVT